MSVKRYGGIEMEPNKHRWGGMNLDQLIGADYALRIFRTSPILRGEALKICDALIDEVREKIKKVE
jgi:hypothetical protein